MHRISDYDMVEFYFQVVTNMLPTKARLHHPSPKPWMLGGGSLYLVQG